MTIQIITSSYPGTPNDPTGAAGLFIRDFALELVRLGHRVIVLTAARKKVYEPDQGVIIEKLSWLGGDNELASVNFFNPLSWFMIVHFLLSGLRSVSRTSRMHGVERTLAMWVVPAGIFGWWGKKTNNISYDVWALGSDIWKIRRVPLGKSLLRFLIRNAERAFADGMRLKRDAEEISGREIEFLPTSRILPKPDDNFKLVDSRNVKKFLYVGRYHFNKGPDVLIEAVGLLPESERKKLHLHMFGFGEMNRQLATMVKRLSLGSMVFLRNTIDAQTLSNYLAKCDYLVIPSRIESIPVVLSDAASCGTPLIVSDAGDMGELVRTCDAGFVFPAENASKLSSILSLALKTDRSSFADGVRRLSAQFNIRETCRKWMEKAMSSDAS